LKKSKEKKKIGRPKKRHSPVNVSIPNEMIDYIESIGHGSKSLGMRLIWEEIVKPVLDGKHKKGK